MEELTTRLDVPSGMYRCSAPISQTLNLNLSRCLSVSPGCVAVRIRWHRMGRDGMPRAVWWSQCFQMASAHVARAQPLCLQCRKPYPEVDNNVLAHPLLQQRESDEAKVVARQSHAPAVTTDSQSVDTIYSAIRGESNFFCSADCWSTFRMVTSGKYSRMQLFEIQLGVCQLCGFDMHTLYHKVSYGAGCPVGNWSTCIDVRTRQVHRLEAVSLRTRALQESAWAKHHRALIAQDAPAPAAAQKLLNALNKLISQQARDNIEGVFWQADHIVPVVHGGGTAGLDNFRTLCLHCHREVIIHG